MLEKETLKEIVRSLLNGVIPEVPGVEIEHERGREEGYRGFEYPSIDIYRIYFDDEQIGEVEIVEETTGGEGSVNSFVQIEIYGKTYSPYEFLE